MYILRILTRHNDRIELMVDSVNMGGILTMLEMANNVVAYKIIDSSGVYNTAKLAYQFGGYLYPAGKAVADFDDIKK